MICPASLCWRGWEINGRKFYSHYCIAVLNDVVNVAVFSEMKRVFDPVVLGDEDTALNLSPTLIDPIVQD